MLATHLVALFTTFLAFLTAQALGAPGHSGVAHAKRAVPLSRRDIETFLDAHNEVRAQHDAPPLTWSHRLAERASFWADLCYLKNSDGFLLPEPYGEHIVAATGDFPIRSAVSTFLKDKDQYSPAKPVYNHWTQVVWKSTTEVGCGIASCLNAINRKPGRETVYVCLYNPPGNVVGHALENVSV